MPLATRGERGDSKTWSAEGIVFNVTARLRDLSIIVGRAVLSRYIALANKPNGMAFST